MASTRTARGRIVPVEGSGTSDESVADMVLTATGNEHAAAATKDFFSLFYLPSSQTYGEDVHFTQSSYSVPFQGAASAVMGGILSVLDTALTVMNEMNEFESESMVSDSEGTKVDDEGGLRGNTTSCASGQSCLAGDRRGCLCKKAARSELSTACTTPSSNDNTSSDGKRSHILEQSVKRESEIDIHDSNIDQSYAQENEDRTPHVSLVGSISTLQLFEEDSGDALKKLLSDLHSESMNDMQIDDVGSRSENQKNEESEYCLIDNESETNDGWLVVCDD